MGLLYIAREVLKILATGSITVAQPVSVDDNGGSLTVDGPLTDTELRASAVPVTTAAGEVVIDALAATTGWAILGNDTANFATTTNHVIGATALEFDKVNGLANTKLAGIAKTLSTQPTLTSFLPDSVFEAAVYLSDVSDVDYVFMRLGTSAAAYSEWRIPDTTLSDGWNIAQATWGERLTQAGQVGAGWDSTSVKWASIGVAFDAETDTLADIAVDYWLARSVMTTY